MEYCELSTEDDHGDLYDVRTDYEGDFKHMDYHWSEISPLPYFNRFKTIEGKTA